MRKYRRGQDEDHIDESWLIPYADILTLLLALFIILFAASEMDKKKYDRIMRGFSTAFTGTQYMLDDSGSLEIDSLVAGEELSQSEIEAKLEAKLEEQMNKETQDMLSIKDSIDKYIEENGLSAQIETKLTSEMLMIMIRDNALFDSGLAQVKPESQQLAVAISKILENYTLYNVEVAGHTDNVPILGGQFASNWNLSTQRALNFMEYLMDSEDVNQSRFRTIGYGEYKPIATNETAEGRAKNRRVEVNILRSVKATNLMQPIF